MNQIKKALVFIVFLLLINFAYAQDYALYSGKFYELKEGQEKIEFEFYNGTYNICENEKKTLPIIVANKANVDNTYSLQAVGASWLSLNVREFSLLRKQSGVVFLDLSPEQNIEGKYNVRINALSSVGGINKEISLNINVEKCYSLKLELEKEEDKVCGGIKKQYSGEIINDGKQKSDIELDVKGPNWVSVDENSFSINPNDKEEFEINADVPSNAKGIFNIVVSAVIKNFPSIKSEKRLSIEVVPKYDCYKADIIAETKIKNDYSNAYVPIKVRNSGVKQANYEISLEAPKWIDAEPKKLNVNSEQIGNFNLNINPSNDIAEGSYPVKINVKFDEIVYSKNIEFILSKNQFKSIKSFLIFYQYYIYVILIIAIILFIFRRQILAKIKTTYKNYKIRQARLRALEAARKARQLKRQIKELEKVKLEIQKVKRYRTRLVLFLIILTVIASLLFFLIYQFDFPVQKEFVKKYYVYFVVGVLISLFIIFLIEFYKPLFKLLKKIK